jgi:hypothetical protein
MVQKAFIGKNALTGGTLDSLDGVDGAARGVTSDATDIAIQLGDVGIVVENDTFSLYQYQDGTGTTEDSPRLILPDTNPTLGEGWVLTGLQIANNFILHENNKYVQGVTVGDVITDLIGMNASDQIAIGDGNIIVDGVNVHIPTGNFAVGSVATTNRFYSLYDSASNYAGLFYNTNANGYGLEVRGGSISTDNALRVADYLNNDLLRVRGSGVITNRWGAVNSGLSIKYLSGGSDAVGVSSVGYFSMGDDTTMTDAILTVKNAGNRGNRANALGSSLFQALFNDGVAFEIDKNGNVGIGNTPPQVELHVYEANARARIESTAIGVDAISLDMHGIELFCGGMNAVLNKYSSAVKFMSADPIFTTQNPKLLAGIFPRATEDYDADTDGGMALDFATTPDDPGASSVPVVAMTIYQNGNVAIGNSGVPSDSRFYSLTDTATTYAGLFINANALGNGLEVRAGSTISQAAFRVADYVNNDLMLMRGNGDTTIIGQVGINTAGVIPAMSTDADDFIIGSGSGSDGMTIYSGTSSTGNIYFADGLVGAELIEGYIQYDHNLRRFNIGARGTLKLQISDTSRFVGQLGVNVGITDFPTMPSSGSDLIVGGGTGSRGMSIYSGTTDTGSIYFAKAQSAPGWNDGAIHFEHDSQTMRFVADTIIRVSIDSNGVRMRNRLAVNIADAAFPFTAAGQDDLVVGTTASNHGMTILSSSSGSSKLYFADSTSAPGLTEGGFLYTHDLSVMDLIVGNDIKAQFFDGASRYKGHVTPSVNNVYSCGADGFRWTTVYAVNGTINTSDKRTKKDIEYVNVLGSEFISMLKPVSFVQKDTVIPESIDEHSKKIIPEKIIKHKETHQGFIAQEVEEVLKELGINPDDTGLFHNLNSDSLGLIYTEFIPPIVSTIHSLQADIAYLKSEIEKLK